MQFEKDDITIAAMILGWVGTLCGVARGTGKIEARIEAMERKCSTLPKFMSLEKCDERREFCGQQNRILFAHGTEEFSRLREEISDNQRMADERHKEIMSLLMEMMKDKR